MISDSYDAMTTDRPYRKALSKEIAISELEKYSGIQFHPLLTRTFIDGVLSEEDEVVVTNDSVEHDDILKRTKEIVDSGVEMQSELLEGTVVEKRQETNDQAKKRYRSLCLQG